MVPIHFFFKVTFLETSLYPGPFGGQALGYQEIVLLKTNTGIAELMNLGAVTL